jgi:hypothetical protein
MRKLADIFVVVMALVVVISYGGQSGAGGAIGVWGQSGWSGSTGDRGPSGFRGASGDLGSTGLLGATGFWGVSGLFGPTGAGGETGSFGNTYSTRTAWRGTLNLDSPIVAFAQNGDQFAWATVDDKDASCHTQVWMRLLGPGTQKMLTRPDGPTCGSATGFGPKQKTHLVLAGGQALWTLRRVRVADKSWHAETDIITAPYASARDEKIKKLVSNGALGSLFGGAAGDARTLVYGLSITGTWQESWITVAPAVVGGIVQRVAGSDTTTVPRTPAPALLAASGEQVAIVVADNTDASGDAYASPYRSVEVLNAASGAVVSTFDAAHFPLDVALAPKVVALLGDELHGHWIEFRTVGGKLIRTLKVPANTASISTPDARAVFSVGDTIQTVSVMSGSPTILTTAASKPIGLSIEGNRVAWAENVKTDGVTRGRIRAITVE